MQAVGSARPLPDFHSLYQLKFKTNWSKQNGC